MLRDLVESGLFSPDQLDFIATKIDIQRKRARTSPSLTYISDDVLENNVFSMLGIIEHFRFARTCRRMYRVSGCPPPPRSYRRPGAWNKHVSFPQSMDTVALFKVAQFVATTSLSVFLRGTLDGIMFSNLSMLRSLHITCHGMQKCDGMFGPGMLPYLEKFVLEKASISDATLMVLPPSLRELELLYCRTVTGSFMRTWKCPLIESVRFASLYMFNSGNFRFLSYTRSLRSLVLDFASVSDDDMAPICDLVLTKLVLISCTNIESLQFMHRMPIETLSIEGCFGLHNNEFMWALNRVGERLRHLSVIDTGVSLTGEIRLPVLVTMRLSYCGGFSDASLSGIRVPQLRYLSVSDSRSFTNAVLAHFVSHALLETLDMSFTMISVGYKAYLETMPALKTVNVHGCTNL